MRARVPLAAAERDFRRKKNLARGGQAGLHQGNAAQGVETPVAAHEGRLTHRAFVDGDGVGAGAASSSAAAASVDVVCRVLWLMRAVVVAADIISRLYLVRVASSLDEHRPELLPRYPRFACALCV